MYKRIFFFVLLIHFNGFGQIDIDVLFESDEKVTNIISYGDKIYFSTENASGNNRNVSLYRLNGKEKVEIFSSDGYPHFDNPDQPGVRGSGEVGSGTSN